MAAQKKDAESYDGPLHVIIVGAGSGGLVIAQALKKNGISYALYEKDSIEGRVRDWGMVYHWSADSIHKLLPQSVTDKLCTAQVNYGLTTPQGEIHEYGTVRNCSTGEIMKLLPTPGGRRVSRRRFQKVLKEGLKIQYDKEVVDIYYPERGVVVHFKDGTTASGSTVIGADGNSSKIRRLLLGEMAEPTILPYILNNFTATYTADQVMFIRPLLAKFTDIGVHPKGVFFLIALQEVPDPKDPSTWSFQVAVSWPTSLRDLTKEENTSKGRLKVMKELTEDFVEPRKSMMAWVPEGTHIPIDRVATWSPVPWDNHGGRVTLVGDAAHSVTANRGQGLNNCINDAENIVTTLLEVKEGKKELAEAMTIYDEEIVRRGAAEEELSRKQTEMAHDWEKFKDSPTMKIGFVSIQVTEEYKNAA